MTTHPEIDMHDSEVPPMSPIPSYSDISPSQAYDSPDPYQSTDQLAKLAKAMTLDSSLSVEPAIRHSHNMGNNNSGYLFSPQSYNGSDMSPVHSNTQSPYYSQQVTPAVSPLGQCSPMQELPPSQYGGMRQSFTSMMQDSANEAIISQGDPMFSQSNLLRQQSPRPLPSCREQSMIHTSPHRLVQAHNQGSNLAMLLNNGHSNAHSVNHHQLPYPNGGTPHHISHIHPHVMHPQHPVMGHVDRFPSDLEHVQIDPLKGWSDLDMENILRNEQDLTEGPDASFDSIGTMGTTSTTMAAPSWVH